MKIAHAKAAKDAKSRLRSGQVGVKSQRTLRKGEDHKEKAILTAWHQKVRSCVRHDDPHSHRSQKKHLLFS